MMINVRSFAIILRKTSVLLAGTRSAMEFYWLPGLPDDVEAMIRGFVI